MAKMLCFLFLKLSSSVGKPDLRNQIIWHADGTIWCRARRGYRN